MLTFATLFALALVLGGPAAGHFYLVSSLIALGMSLTGLCLLAILFFVSLVKLILRDFFSWLALVFGFLAIVGLGGLGYFSYQNPLHDVCTDLKNPPAFQHPAYPFTVAAGSEYLDESLRLNREFNPVHSAKHAELYANVTSDTVKVPANDAYAAIVKAVQAQFPAWKIVLNDTTTHHFEAEVEEPVFGLITDVVIEVRSDPQHAGESTVVMRSRLRSPLPDLGWDAYLLRILRVQIDFVITPLEEQFNKGKPQVPPPAAPAPAQAPPVAPAPATPPAKPAAPAAKAKK
jgi:hypothetical protein